ncbi:MAG: hypothetical protein C0472_10365 [Erythrobacter sp.]|nr:hypothetical protein [Erythrobacter sp.]
MALCLLNVPAAAQADASVDVAPHPAMAGFLAELDAGELDKAASRISRIGEFADEDFFALRPTRTEFVAFLKSCERVSGYFGIPDQTSVPLQKTEWTCADGKVYSVSFWPEDAFHKDARVPRPYLMVAGIETEELRTAREEKRKARSRAYGIPPPPIPIIYTDEQQQELRERREREELTAYARRDTLGQAVLKDDLDPIAEFVTDETQVFYASRDPFFDVRIEHERGKGLASLTATLNRAIAELGQPIAVECFLADGPWPPQACRWELSNPENNLLVEMNFSGPGGTINSIRVFRETPAEMNAFRQKAIEAGITNG